MWFKDVVVAVWVRSELVSFGSGWGNSIWVCIRGETGEVVGNDRDMVCVGRGGWVGRDCA